MREKEIPFEGKVKRESGKEEKVQGILDRSGNLVRREGVISEERD